jgi:RNA 3'-terminal phosphate cyclase (ATP)
MSIAERKIAVVRRAVDWLDRECFMRELPVDQGAGNILMLEARFEHITEIVGGFAQLRVMAEPVAKLAVGQMW